MNSLVTCHLGVLLAMKGDESLFPADKQVCVQSKSGREKVAELHGVGFKKLY